MKWGGVIFIYILRIKNNNEGRGNVNVKERIGLSYMLRKYNDFLID